MGGCCSTPLPADSFTGGASGRQAAGKSGVAALTPVDGHRFELALLRRRGEVPRLSAACAAWFDLCGIHHLAGADAAGGGVVPPPLVGMLLWMARSPQLQQSFVAETAAFRPPRDVLPGNKLTGDAERSVRCVANFLRERSIGQLGVVCLPIAPPFNHAGMTVKAFAGRGPWSSFTLDFGGHLRLTRVNGNLGSPGLTRSTVYVYGNDAFPAEFEQHQQQQWRELHYQEVTTDVTFSQSRRVMSGSALDALWLIDDVACRLGFRRLAYSSIRNAEVCVEYGRAARFIASLGEQSPMTVSDLRALAYDAVHGVTGAVSSDERGPEVIAMTPAQQ